MTKAALAIPWWSAVKITTVWPIYVSENKIMRQSLAFKVCLKILQNTNNILIFV